MSKKKEVIKDEKELINLLKLINSRSKSLSIKKREITKTIQGLKNQEKKIKKELRSLKKKNKFIVSIGLDKRWATYNCIVKYQSFHFSFYLGKEKKIKKLLQQFYREDLREKNMKFINTQIKKIVQSVVPNYLKKSRSKNKLKFDKIISLYLSSGEWDYWSESY